MAAEGPSRRPRLGDVAPPEVRPYDGAQPTRALAGRRFVLQWHVTERCNLRCRHCYQEGYSTPELELHDLRCIVDQFKELLDHLRRETAPRPFQGHINVTGGEPFARQDFFELLDVFAANRRHFTFGILTNGTLIDAAVAQRLQALGPRFVQVSVEGSPSTNDAVRGRGVYDRTVQSLAHLARAGIPTVVAFTAHGANHGEFQPVARLACASGVTRVWADRLIPSGQGADLDGAVLSPQATREFFEQMYAARQEAVDGFCVTEVSMGRALQFLVGGGTPYRCLAGEDLVTVQANGDLCPCRRLPIRVGNLTETRLIELYDSSELFQALRAHRMSKGCEACRFAQQCRGGLRCLAYALTGDPFRPDPGCWLTSPTAQGELAVTTPTPMRTPAEPYEGSARC